MAYYLLRDDAICIADYAVDEHPYDKDSTRPETYSDYNQGWNDACDYIRGKLEEEKPADVEPVKPSRMKTCRWCGKQFEVSGHDKAYCCDECREAKRYAREQERQKNARKKQAVKKETVMPPRLCVVCGSSFTPKVGHQLTCCPACSKEYRLAKMRIYKKNQKAREAGNGEKCVFGEASGDSEGVL